MEQKVNDQEAQKVMREIITEAWENETFKQELINNPEAALEKFLGRSLNTDKKIVISDQSNPDNLYITIPAKPDWDSLELSEEQLEMVAGGGDDISLWDAFVYVATHPVQTVAYIINN